VQARPAAQDGEAAGTNSSSATSRESSASSEMLAAAPAVSEQLSRQWRWPACWVTRAINHVGVLM